MDGLQTVDRSLKWKISFEKFPGVIKLFSSAEICAQLIYEREKAKRTNSTIMNGCPDSFQPVGNQKSAKHDSESFRGSAKTLRVMLTIFRAELE